MSRISIDELVLLDDESLGEAGCVVDWRSAEDEVVEAFAERLDPEDALAWTEADGRVTPVYRGVAHPVPLTLTGSDRYVMIFSIMELIRDKYTVFRDADADGDTHVFHVLRNDEAEDLARRHPQWMRKHLEALVPGVDGFSGLDVPWLGHEDHAPDFAAKRRKLDQDMGHYLQGARREMEAIAAEAMFGRRPEASERMLPRQWAAAAAYGVGAVLFGLAATSGLAGAAKAIGALWFTTGLLAVSAIYHLALARRMRRTGWRPAVWVRVVPGAVIVLLMFMAPQLLRGG